MIFHILLKMQVQNVIKLQSRLLTMRAVYRVIQI